MSVLKQQGRAADDLRDGRNPAGKRDMKRSARNPEVDAYIAAAEPFARPILKHLRKTLHVVCPDAAETMKWSLPHFEYAGENLCILAAARKHCSFTFYKQALMRDARLRENPSLKANKRFLGQLKSLSDLPDAEELEAFIREAMDLNERGVKLPAQPSKTPSEIPMPAEFGQALQQHRRAREVFESRSASFRKEYLVWITDAKTDATRQKRIAEAIGWIAEGKGRFWKYQK